MEFIRQVVVFDAFDVEASSSFWAGFLDGFVLKDKDGTWHSVFDKHNKWVIGIQFSKDHIRPNCPNGEKQQVHLDFHVLDFESDHSKVMGLGATILKEWEDTNSPHGFQVYADPAGHPFCLGWGHPTNVELDSFFVN